MTDESVAILALRFFPLLRFFFLPLEDESLSVAFFFLPLPFFPFFLDVLVSASDELRSISDSDTSSSLEAFFFFRFLEKDKQIVKSLKCAKQDHHAFAKVTYNNENTDLQQEQRRWISYFLLILKSESESDSFI